MSSIRFRTLSSPAYLVTVSQSGAKEELSTLDAATSPPPEPEPDPTPETEVDPVVPPEPEPEPEPEPTPGLTVEIAANRTSGTAPAGMIFQATAQGFDVRDAKRDLRYKWDFGDPKSAPFTAPTERFDAQVNGRSLDWRNSNIAYTYRAGHTFFPKAAEFGGAPSKEFTVTCTVQDRNGNLARGSQKVTVANPDVVFATTTVGVDTGGNYADLRAEYPQAKGFTSFGAAYSAIGSTGRILLKRGQKLDGGITIKNKARISIGSYGDRKKPKPVVDILGGGGGISVAGGTAGEVCLSEFDLAGDYDVTKEKSPSGDTSSNGLSWGNFSEGGMNTVHDVWLRDINKIGIYPQGKYANSRHMKEFVFSNVRIENFRDYGILISVTPRIAFLGVAIVDTPMKMQGKNRKEGRYNEHGPIRVTTPRLGSWWVFDVFESQSWSGWSGGAAPYDYNGVPAPQSAWRFNPGNSASRGDPDAWRDAVDWNLSRFVMEGGSPPTMAAIREPTYTPTTITGIMDKGIIIGSAAVPRCLSMADYGNEVTNILCVIPRMNLIDGKNYGAAVNGSGNTPEQLTFRGVTTVNWIDPGANRHGGDSPADFVEWDSGKFGKYACIFHCPNNKQSADLSSQLDLGQRLFAPRYPGLRFIDHYNDNGRGLDAEIIDTKYAALDTFQQNGRTQASIVMPIPKKGQLTTSKADAPIDDIFGEIRPATPHRGCVEPSSVRSS